MKKVLLLAILTVLLTLCFCVSVFASDVVVISTADELSALMRDSDKWSGNYKLAADIKMQGHIQKPMGNYEVPFSGTFDGDGHYVEISIHSEGTAGLFGAVSGTVKNVTVCGEVENTFWSMNAETKIAGKYPGTGAVAGVALSGATIENCVGKAQVEGPGNTGGVIGVVYNFGYEPINIIGCKNEGTVYATAGNCGGVIGRIYISSAAFPAVTVKDCVNYTVQKLEINNRNRLGGIAGYVRSEAGVVVIENCTNYGDITARNTNDEAASNDYPYAGGIVGRVEAVSDYSSAVRIIKCSNTARITSGKYAGGIVTYIQRAATCGENVTEVLECINTGVVDGPRYAGGIVAYTENKCAEMTYSSISNCANYGGVYSTDYSGGILGRQYGFNVKNCYDAGLAKATVSGAVVGIAEGQIYSEIDGCYYLDTANAKAIGNNKSTLTIALYTEAVSADEAKAEGTFKKLDFVNVWTMGESGPTLKMLTGESTSGDTNTEVSDSPFKASRTYEGQFADVTEDKWFYKYVKTAYEYTLANGTSNTKFSPDNKFTVAQALTAAANIHSVYYGKRVRAAYQGEAWYDPYVAYCIDNGIIRFGMFTDYNKNITRGEMAIVFASILPDSEYAATRSGSNPDVTVDMACYSAVAKLYGAGIVGGDAGSGNFRPSDEIVRSEACVIFTRIALADERIK